MPTTAVRSATGSALRLHVILFQIILFLAAFLIVLSRRPDAVLNAQFYGEDGTLWYPDAYQLGLWSLFKPAAGYLHILTRLIALLTLLVPFALAPLVANVSAIVVQILPVNVFCSGRFSTIPLPMRLFGSVLYLAVPNSFEIHANLTNVQWHLSLLACLLLLARPAASMAWRVFDGVVLGLTSVSSPMGVLLVLVAVGLWWKRRDAACVRSFALLVPGAAIELLTFALSWRSRRFTTIGPHGETILINARNGASLTRFFVITGRQVFVSSLLGLKTQSSLVHLRGVHWIDVIATIIGFAVFLYVMRYAVIELKIFVAFALGMLALALIHPLAGLPFRSQWDWLCIPGCGNRYYFMPMLAFLASLVWIATRGASSPAWRGLAIALLLLLPIGIVRDWRYPPYVDYHFPEYARQFDQAPPGAEVTIPINPDWTMKLTKR